MIGNEAWPFLECRKRWWTLRCVCNLYFTLDPLRRYAIVRPRLGVAGTVAGNHQGLRARSFACADSHGN